MKHIIAFVIFFMISALPALASTFCVGGLGMPPQCMYEDVRDCRRAANTHNTSCLVSADATFSYVGSSRYCVVGSERVAECMYVDRSQCNDDSYRSGRVCFDRETMNDPNNPFKYDNRVQY